jgi:DnaJ-class molecular chaperone
MKKSINSSKLHNMCPVCNGKGYGMDNFTYLSVKCDACKGTGKRLYNNKTSITILKKKQKIKNSLIEEAKLLKEKHPSKDCRFFADSVLTFLTDSN